MNIRPAYTFDDLLLTPRHSRIASRSDVDISTTLHPNLSLRIPIVSSNMSNVTEVSMAAIMVAKGGLPILHRFSSNEEIVRMYQAARDLTNMPKKIGCSVGVKRQDRALIDSLYLEGCRIFCVDVAHGDHIACLEMTEHLAKQYPHTVIISGNVATRDGAVRLYNAGAHVIKCGIGSGSICSTRIETGNGVPQMTALSDVYEASLHDNIRDGSMRKFRIISDGGIKDVGDIVKALCFSDAVMLGNMLAGTNEAPGMTITIDGTAYKEYVGSSTHKTSHVEGVRALVPVKGPVTDVLKRIEDGLTSGLSYQGASSLEQLRDSPEFVLLTNSGLKESHPHNVFIKGQK